MHDAPPVSPNDSNGGKDNPFSQVGVEVTVTVGRARTKIGDLLALDDNAVLPLDRKLDDPVELYIGGRLIALGELQENKDGAGLEVRLTKVIDVRDGLF